MPQPTPYNITTDFSADEASNLAGRSTVRTANLDAEFANIETTLDALCANIALLQRDDGALHDAIVTTDSLSANVKALFGAGGITPRGAWVTATAYAVRDVVETLSPLVSYICVIAHTSGVFATDRAAGKWMVMGQEPGVGSFASLTLTTGGVTLGTNNTQDLAATANRFRSGYFGTTVFAAVSVVAPLLQSTGAVDLVLGANGGTDWSVLSTGKHWAPNVDNTQNIGSTTKRIAALFSPIHDSGTAAAISLKTNNGTTQALINHTAAGVNAVTLTAGATGIQASIGVGGPTVDATAGLRYSTHGLADHLFYTSDFTEVQFQVVGTAGANRRATITGSNGGDPTLSATAGHVAIGSATVNTKPQSLLDISGANAGQIKFPASQNASADANTFDDYEEGTWTPSIGGSATYTAASGFYTKAGNRVFFTCYIQINAVGTGSTTTISGLPFANIGLSGNNVGVNARVVSGSATAIVSSHGEIGTAASTIILFSRAAASAADAANAIFANSALVEVSGSYHV